MNIKAVVPLIAGIGIAGLAGKLGLDYVNKARASTSAATQLWTCVEDVPRGVEVADHMLRPLKFPVDLAPRNALADKAKILGRVPHTGLSSGVPILDSMLLPQGAKAGVYVPPGLRAVAVKIDESSGVDNHLEPGCHVDVVGYFNVRGQAGRQETIARTIVENVQVAAVGARLAPEKPEKPDAKAEKSAPKSKDKQARAVTLLVKPDQVPILHLAEQRGEIKLSMRNNDEENVGLSARTNEKQMLGEEDAEADPTHAESKPGLLDSIAGWFNKKPDPAPQPVADAAQQPEPQPDPEPKLEWTMVIINGIDQRTFGWAPGKPSQPIELTAEGPNLFQDPQKQKSKNPPADPPDKKSGPQSEPEPDPEPQSEEPKELVG